MPVSTIYEYYASKEELSYAVPQSSLVKFFEEFRDTVVEENTAYDRLRCYLLLAADFARRNPEWARVLYLEILAQRSRDREPARGHVRRIRPRHAVPNPPGRRSRRVGGGTRAYETAAILNGSTDQIIITALLYRRPGNLTAATASILDRPIGAPTGASAVLV